MEKDVGRTQESDNDMHDVMMQHERKKSATAYIAFDYLDAQYKHDLACVRQENHKVLP